VEMRPYSCVFQQTAVSDLLLLGLSELTLPVRAREKYKERLKRKKIIIMKK
jgi:hypothetical protein